VVKLPGIYPVFRFPWAKPKRQSSVAKTYVNMKIAWETQTQNFRIPKKEGENCMTGKKKESVEKADSWGNCLHCASVNSICNSVAIFSIFPSFGCKVTQNAE